MTEKKIAQEVVSDVHSEFDVPVFVERYEATADTFINTEGAAKSLMNMLPRGGSVFELGLGTGYFSQFLLKEGYRVSGIQPGDGMLQRLKKEYPEIDVVKKAYIQDYIFKKRHEAIVSHSAVFLFTRMRDFLMEQGTNLVFQSFIKDEEKTFKQFHKIMAALKRNGKFYINIQDDAQKYAEIDSNLAFEMPSYEYDFDRKRVEKVFAITQDGERKVLPSDISCILKWDEFEQNMTQRGYQLQISEDNYWVIVSRNK